MADSVRYAISVDPLEEITDEQANTYTVISGEVGRSLGGSGVATVADYSAVAAVQGYKDATVNYLNCVDDASTQISTETSASFVFIKNTGFYYSAATVLGAVATEHVVVTTVNTGTTVIASLGPGEAQIFKALQATQTIDCTKIKVRTYEANGGAAGASDHLAVELLIVD